MVNVCLVPLTSFMGKFDPGPVCIGDLCVRELGGARHLAWKLALLRFQPPDRYSRNKPVATPLIFANGGSDHRRLTI